MFLIRTSFAEMIGMNCNPDARRFRILHDYLPEIRRPVQDDHVLFCQT